MKTSLRISLFFLTAALPALSSRAQEYVAQKQSVGLNFGALSYSGRFGVGSSIASKSSLFTSLFYRRRVYANTYVRAELLGGRLRADNRREESQMDKPVGAFQSEIVEVSVKGEYDFVNLLVHKAAPFVTAGMGAYRLFNYYSTEGDKSGSEKTGFIVPVGGGVKYKLNDRIRLTAEGGIRFFSKNLDNRKGENVSNPNKYYNFGLGVIYELSPYNPLW